MEKCPKHGLDVCEQCSLDLYEAENASLRADVQRLRSKQVSPEFLHKLDAVTDERDKLLLRYEEAIRALSETHTPARCPYNAHGNCLPCNVLKSSLKREQEQPKCVQCGSETAPLGTCGPLQDPHCKPCCDDMWAASIGSIWEASK